MTSGAHLRFGLYTYRHKDYRIINIDIDIVDVDV